MNHFFAMISELILFTFLLNIDTLSGAFALGLRHFSPRRSLSYAIASASSGGIATALGFALGWSTKYFIVFYEHWISLILLVLVGIHMCWEAFHHQLDDASILIKPSHGILRILVVSTLTSVDNFAVGVSFWFSAKPIVAYCFAIAFGAFLATYLGLYTAKKIPSNFGIGLEVMGGLILVAIGFKSFFS